MAGKSQKVYEGVLFSGKEGDLTIASPGIAFQSYEDGPPTRFKWGSIQKQMITKPSAPKAMLKLKIVKQGQTKTITFQLRDHGELEALRDDVEARLPKEPSPAPEPQTTTTTRVKEKASDSDTITKPEDNVSEENKKDLKQSTKVSSVAAVGQETTLIPVATGLAEPILPVEVEQVQEQPITKNSTVIASATSTDANVDGSIYGTSKYLTPARNARLVAEADFEDFAPCSCILYKCFVHDKIRKRTYVRAYENRIEANVPYNPCCCWGDERCMVDSTRVFYFDKPPNRVGMVCCGIVPCICCGPPVVYTKVPKWCCALVDMRPCLGEQVLHAMCDCYGFRCCLCCGPQCYQFWSVPLFLLPFKRGEDFLAHWKGALKEYQDKHGIAEDQRAKFFKVEDRFCDTDSGQHIEAIFMER